MKLFLKKTKKSKDLFLNRLTQAGFGSENIDCQLAWETFKQFYDDKFVCSEDALSFETGIYCLKYEPMFYYCMTRQFTHEKDALYAGMEQLKLTIYFEASPLVEDLSCILWSFDFVDLNSFYEVVENSEHFSYPPAVLKPVDWELTFKTFS